MRQQSILELGLAPGGAASAPAPCTTAAAGWNRAALAAIRAARMAPGPAAHALAALHTCLYNAWAAYDDIARQTPQGFAIRLPHNERHGANRALAMHHAAWAIAADRFPAQRHLFDAHAARLGLDAGPASVLSPPGIGRTQARAMADACREDGDAAFAVAALDLAPLPAPPAAAALPSAADWCLLAQRIAAQADADMDAEGHAVLLFFVLGNALADAAIAAPGGNPGVMDAAAAEALRRFTGVARADARTAGLAFGKKIGALVFERACRYWMGETA